MAKNGPFLSKTGHTWQAYQRFKVVQNGPKWAKMVNQGASNHFRPFLALLDPFGPSQTKTIFLPQMDKVGFFYIYFRFGEAK